MCAKDYEKSRYNKQEIVKRLLAGDRVETIAQDLGVTIAYVYMVFKHYEKNGEDYLKLKRPGRYREYPRSPEEEAYIVKVAMDSPRRHGFSGRLWTEQTLRKWSCIWLKQPLTVYQIRRLRMKHNFAIGPAPGQVRIIPATKPVPVPDPDPYDIKNFDPASPSQGLVRPPESVANPPASPAPRRRGRPPKVQSEGVAEGSPEAAVGILSGDVLERMRQSLSETHARMAAAAHPPPPPPAPTPPPPTPPPGFLRPISRKKTRR